jgi:hypothetical protein
MKNFDPLPVRMSDVISGRPWEERIYLSRPDQDATVDHVKGTLRIRDAHEEGGFGIV